MKRRRKVVPICLIFHFQATKIAIFFKVITLFLEVVGPYQGYGKTSTGSREHIFGKNNFQDPLSSLPEAKTVSSEIFTIFQRKSLRQKGSGQGWCHKNFKKWKRNTFIVCIWSSPSFFDIVPRSLIKTKKKVAKMPFF